MFRFFSTSLIATGSAFLVWSKLSDNQKDNIRQIIKTNRRKLANLISPDVNDGDLTNLVDPSVLEEIAKYCSDDQPKTVNPIQ
jgi:predicted house-cleaning noncanonical NTP pyrophosphatase (MazG superfamily)